MLDMHLKVLSNNIIIKKIIQQKYGDLLLPENTADNFLKGIVVGLGEGKRDSKGEIIPFTVKIGDEVIFPKYKGHQINLKEIFIILSEEEIIAIIDKK